jgi:transposase
MDTIEVLGYTRARKRRHSAEFKAKVIEACRHPGVSIAAVALDHRLNANMLRIWVAKAQKVDGVPPKPAITPAFVPVPITVAKTKPDIVIDIQRGASKVQVRWPVEAASDCAALLRDWLR